MAHRKFWQRPSLHDDEEHARHRPVTWVELFFDLFVVVAVARIAHPLYAATSWRTVGVFALQFLPLFWVWVGLTFYQERFETEGLENRLILFVFMVGVSGMAAYAHDGLGENWRGYIGAFAATRLVTIGLWIRAGVYVPAFRGVAWRYGVLFGISQGLLYASMWTDGDQRWTLFAFSMVLEVVTPLTILGENAKLPKVSTSKHPERFGLFTLIVLGEAVAGVVSGLADQHQPGAAELGRAVAALAVGLGLWWVYFDFVGRRPFKPTPLHGYVWVYLHLWLFLVIVTGGIALAATVAGHTSELHQRLAGIAIGGFLAVCGALELVLRRLPDEPTHPVISPGLKLVSAPIAAVSGFVVGGGVQLCWLFATLVMHMVYGLWVWFTQDVPETTASHHAA